MSAHGHRLEIGGAAIHYECVGAGEPLVLLHGLSGSTRWWSRNVPELARSHRVYTIDLIGFGRSRGRRRFLLHQARELVHDWWERLRLGPGAVIGHSMGGRIAAEFAAADPTRVRRLVLVNAAMRLQRVGFHRHAWGLFRELPRVPPSLMPIVVTDTFRAGPFNTLRASYDLGTADMTVELAAIRASTLIVWGERDRVVPIEVGLAIHEQMPGSRLVMLPAGHVPMWERPAEFNRVVGEFLAEPEAPG